MTYSESGVSNWRRRIAHWAPLDLVVVGVLAVTTLLTVEAGISSPIRFLVVLPTLFVLPGYVTVALLFPHGAAPVREYESGIPSVDRVTLSERFALAFGLSVALLPFFGIAIAVSPWALEASVIAGTIVGFVLAVGLVALFRRSRLPGEDRFRLPVERWIDESRGTLATGPPADRALSLFLVVAIVIALATVGWALAAPQDGEQFTDLAILNEGEDGDLVADEYPDEMTVGQSTSLVSAVENHEGEEQTYTVVVTIQPAGEDGELGAGTEVERYSATVEPGERWTEAHEITPEEPADEARVNYLVYDDTPPGAPTPEDADRHAYFWTTVDGA